MPAVKSSCKDRWRQVLAEADRIDDKRLRTLETAISVNQTSEMLAKRLQLVLPRSLPATFRAIQQGWLFSLALRVSYAVRSEFLSPQPESRLSTAEQLVIPAPRH